LPSLRHVSPYVHRVTARRKARVQQTFEERVLSFMAGNRQCPRKSCRSLSGSLEQMSARRDDGGEPKWRPWRGREEAVGVCLGMLPKRGGKVSADTTRAEVPKKVAKSESQEWPRQPSALAAVASCTSAGSPRGNFQGNRRQFTHI
jgi:hypothetical protein